MIKIDKQFFEEAYKKVSDYFNSLSKEEMLQQLKEYGINLYGEDKKIKCAAIRKDGVIYEGRNHSEIICNAQPRGSLKCAEQGFVTYGGRFVDRVEGLQIAKEYNQIITKHGNKDELYSEDLYM